MFFTLGTDPDFLQEQPVSAEHLSSPYVQILNWEEYFFY